MELTPALKRAVGNKKKYDLKAHRDKLGMIESAIEDNNGHIKTLKDLRVTVFGGASNEVVTREGILMAFHALSHTMALTGLFSAPEPLPYVRKRAQPNLAYLICVFDQLSTDAIVKITALNKDASKKLSKLKTSNPL